MSVALTDGHDRPVPLLPRDHLQAVVRASPPPDPRAASCGLTVVVSDACVARPVNVVLGVLETWSSGRSNEVHMRTCADAARSELARGTDADAVTAMMMELLDMAAPEDLAQAARSWLHDVKVRPCLRSALATHQARAARMFLLTDLVAPLHEELRAFIGADAVLGPGSAGEPAVQRRRGLVRRLGGEGRLSSVWAYGADAADVLMLGEVGHPIVVGDQPRLLASAAAAAAAWTVVD